MSPVQPSLRVVSIRARHMLLVAVATSGLSASVQAQYVTVAGGPTYDSTVGTGAYFSSFSIFGAQSINTSGVMVFEAGKKTNNVDQGTRAYSVDSLGNVTTLSPLTATDASTQRNRALSINNAGVIVGSSTKYNNGVSQGGRAVRWSPAGVLTELGSLGDSTTGGLAYDINELGLITGSTGKRVNGAELGSRAVIWQSSGAATELQTLGTTSAGIAYAGAAALNDFGTAVGYSGKYVNGTDRGRRAVKWSSNGQITELQNLGTNSSGYADGVAYNINSSGQVVGWLEKYVGGVNLGYRAAIWSPSGTIVELQTLSPQTNGYIDTAAESINDSGVAVGGSYKFVNNQDRGTRAMRWDSSGAGVELMGLGESSSGYTDGYAVQITNKGVIAGYMNKYVSGVMVTNSSRAVVWSPNGSILDLNTLIDPASGWTLTNSQSISENGWVTGLGNFDSDGAGPKASYIRAFSLNLATSSTWSNSSGGTWTSASNWNNAIAPHFATNATFNLNSTYSVNVAENAEVGSIAVSSGRVTLSLGSNSLQNYGNLAVGGGTLVHAGTLKIGTASAGQIGVSGNIQLSNGTLEVGQIDLGSTPSLLSWTSGTLKITSGPTTIGTTNAVGRIASSLTLNSSKILDAQQVTVESGGSLSISGGQLRASSLDVTNAGSFSFSSGSIQVNSGAFTVGNALNQTLSGSISGTGSLVKSGSGTVTIQGAATHTGGTTINSGTLTVGTNGSLAGDIVNNANLTFAKSATHTFAGSISGSGSVTQNSGTLTLSGSNSYLGGTTISNATLRISSNFNLGHASGEVRMTNATLALDSALNLARPIIATSTATLDTGAFDTTFTGVISGSGTFRKTGTGQFTLSGTNTQSGGTTFVGGINQISSDSAIGAAGSTLTLTDATLRLTSPLTISRRLNLTGSSATIDTNGHNLAFTSSVNSNGQYIAGQYAYSGLNKVGAGAISFNSTTAGQYLNGPVSLSQGTIELNSYGTYTYTNTAGDLVTYRSGGSVINGSLTIGDGLGGANSDVVRALYSNQIGSNAAVTITASGLLDLSATPASVGQSQFTSNFYNYAGSLGGSGNVALGANSFSIGFNNAPTTFSGNISGTSWLQKYGSGTLEITSAQSFAGYFSLDGGQVLLASAGASFAQAQQISVSGGLFRVDNSVQVNSNRLTSNGWTAVYRAGELELRGNASTVVNESIGNLQVSDGGKLTLVSDGSRGLILSASYLYTSGGLIRGTNLGQGTPGSNNSTNLMVTSTPSMRGMSDLPIISRVVGDASATGLGRSFVTYDSRGVRPLDLNSEYAQTLSTGRNVRLTNAVTGMNGPTTVNSLLLDAGGSVSGTGQLIVNSGAILAAGGANGGIHTGSVVVLPENTYSNVSYSYAMITTVNDLTISSAIVPHSSFNNQLQFYKSGPGTLTLSGANTYVGSTYILEGTLKLTGNGRVGSGYLYVGPGAMLDTSEVGKLELRDGGTIGGSGGVKGTIGVYVNGKIAPGNSPGEFLGETLEWGEGGAYDWELRTDVGGAGNGYDTITISESISLLATESNPFTINLLSLAEDNSPGLADFDATVPHTWTLLTADSGLDSFNLNALAINLDGFENELVGGSFDLSISGNQLLLNFTTAVPEPSSALLLAIGALGLGRRRRRI